MDSLHWQASLPKKRMAVGVLLLNVKDEILIVKPTYRHERLVPGGIVEADESPLEACIREVREEVGVGVTMNRLLCVDYGVANSNRTESLHFIFLADGWLKRMSRKSFFLPLRSPILSSSQLTQQWLNWHQDSHAESDWHLWRLTRTERYIPRAE